MLDDLCAFLWAMSYVCHLGIDCGEGNCLSDLIAQHLDFKTEGNVTRPPSFLICNHIHVAGVLQDAAALLAALTSGTASASASATASAQGILNSLVAPTSAYAQASKK